MTRWRDEPREDWLVREQFRVVRVSSLPFAHNPFKCDHRQLFDESAEDATAEGRRFFQSLSAAQFAACAYHQTTDWRTLASASVRLFRGFADRPVCELLRAVEGLPSSEWDREALYGLFVDPIVWGRGNESVTNGQHRICAIRASGARLCAIDHNRFDPYAPAE
jgi:hypothetical protein